MGLKIEIQKQLDKKIRKKRIPRKILERFMHSFSIIAETEETNAFDIKRLQTEKGVFFRLRIGSYRSIFRISKQTLTIEDIDVRGEVYKRWEQNL